MGWKEAGGLVEVLPEYFDWKDRWQWRQVWYPVSEPRFGPRNSWIQSSQVSSYFFCKTNGCYTIYNIIITNKKCYCVISGFSRSVNEKLAFWDVTECRWVVNYRLSWPVGPVEPAGCQETSVTTNLNCVTCQNSEDPKKFQFLKILYFKRNHLGPQVMN